MFLNIYGKHFDNNREIKSLYKFLICTTTLIYKDNNAQNWSQEYLWTNNYLNAFSDK